LVAAIACAGRTGQPSCSLSSTETRRCGAMTPRSSALTASCLRTRTAGHHTLTFPSEPANEPASVDSFALHEAVLVLARLVHRYDIAGDSDDELAIGEPLTLMPKDFRIRLARRSPGASTPTPAPTKMP